MICRKCGKTIPDDSLYCPNCGSAVELVSYQDSYDKILSDEVNEIMKEDEYFEYIKEKNENKNYMDDPYLDDDFQDEYNPKTFEDHMAYNKVKKYKDAKNNKKNNNKKKIKLGIIGVSAIFIILLGFIIFRTNSYTYQMFKANSNYKNSKYEKAINYYDKAFRINSKKAEPLVGKSKSLIKLERFSEAYDLLLEAIDLDDTCSDAYLTLADLYYEDDNLDAITQLFENVTNKRVIKKCKKYISDKPTSNHDSGTYTKELQIKLKAGNNTIYYTLDGSIPDIYSDKYTEPIDLNYNGSVIIQAISVNDLGISSALSSFEYVMDLPILYSPDVNPGTGQYNNSVTITISDIPDGYKAYYTLDGSTPDENSSKYSSPIKIDKEFIKSKNLDSSNIVFSAVLISSDGKKISDITTRTYEIYNIE